MGKIPPMPAGEAEATEQAYSGILDQLSGVVAEAQIAAARCGESGTFARIAYAIATYDHRTASRIGAAAIVQLAGARCVR